jgi:hypothetical protein
MHSMIGISFRRTICCRRWLWGGGDRGPAAVVFAWFTEVGWPTALRLLRLGLEYVHWRQQSILEVAWENIKRSKIRQRWHWFVLLYEIQYTSSRWLKLLRLRQHRPLELHDARTEPANCIRQLRCHVLKWKLHQSNAKLTINFRDLFVT